MMPPGAFKWVTIDVDPLPDDRIIRLKIEGEAVDDLRAVTEGGDPRIVSIGVTGFFVCESGDERGRAAFLEATALDNLEELAFNRAPALIPALA